MRLLSSTVTQQSEGERSDKEDHVARTQDTQGKKHVVGYRAGEVEEDSSRVTLRSLSFVERTEEDVGSIAVESQDGVSVLWKNKWESSNTCAHTHPTHH